MFLSSLIIPFYEVGNQKYRSDKCVLVAEERISCEFRRDLRLEMLAAETYGSSFLYLGERFLEYLILIMFPRRINIGDE